MVTLVDKHAAVCLFDAFSTSHFTSWCNCPGSRFRPWCFGPLYDLGEEGGGPFHGWRWCLL